MSQTDLINLCKKDTAFGEKMTMSRRLRARGEFKYERRATQETTVVERDEMYDDTYDTGYAYYVDDYLELLKAPSGLRTLKEKAEFIFEQSGQKIFKNRAGEYVVKESNLPQRAAYAYKEGGKQSTALHEVTCFSDNDDAETAFEEFKGDAAAEDAKPSAGRVRSRSRSGSKRSAGGSVARLASVAQRQGAASPAPSLARSCRNSMARERSPSPAVSARGRRTGTSRSHSRSPRPRRSAQSPVGEESASVAQASTPGAKKKLRVTLVHLKTSNSKKLLSLGEELLEDLLYFNDESFFDGAWNKRDVMQMSSRLETASNKCSLIIGEEYKDAADELADRLASANDVLVSRYSFLDDARQKPRECMLVPVDECRKRFFKQLSAPLSMRVFAAIGAAGVVQLRPGASAMLRDVVSFLNCRGEPGRLSLFYAPGSEVAGTANETETTAVKVQVSCVVNLIDHTFANFGEEEFVQAWEYLFEQCGIVGHTAVEPLGAVGRALVPGWAHQCVQDFSLVLLMKDVLKRRAAKAVGKDLELTSRAKRAIAQKATFSLRLRVFRGARGREGNVGRSAWQYIDELMTKSESLTDLEKKVVTTWRNEIMTQGVGDDVDFEKYVNWVSDGHVEVIKTFADSIHEIRDSADEEVKAGIAWLRKLVVSIRAIMESVCGLPNVKAFVHRFFDADAAAAVPDMEADTDENPHTEGLEIMEALVDMSDFAECVERKIEKSRADDEILTELHEHMQLLWQAMRLNMECEETPAATDEKGPPACAEKIELWAELHTRRSNLKPVPSFVSGLPNATKFLMMLRGWNFDNLVADFLNKRLSISVLAHTGSVDGRLIASFQQYAGALPQAAGAIVARAKAFQKCSEVASKLNAGTSFGIHELTSVHVSNQLLKDCGQASVEQMLQVTSTAWEATFQAWASDCEWAKFKELHDEFLTVVKAAETGDLKDCAWCQQPEIPEIQVKMKAYRKMVMNAHRMHRVATSLQDAVKSCDDLAHCKQTVDSVLSGTCAVNEVITEAKNTLCTVVYTHLMCQKPRPETFAADFKKSKEWIGKFDFKHEMLPPYVRHLVKEYTTGKAHDGSEAKAATGSASTTASTASQSSQPSKICEVAKNEGGKSRKFAGVSRLLAKKG